MALPACLPTKNIIRLALDFRAFISTRHQDSRFIMPYLLVICYILENLKIGEIQDELHGKTTVLFLVDQAINLVDVRKVVKQFYIAITRLASDLGVEYPVYNPYLQSVLVVSDPAPLLVASQLSYISPSITIAFLVSNVFSPLAGPT